MKASGVCGLLLGLVACDGAPTLPVAGGAGTDGNAAGSAAQPAAGMPAMSESGSAGAGGTTSTNPAGGGGSSSASVGGAGAGAGAVAGAGFAGAVAAAGAAGSATVLESPPGFFSGGYLMSSPWMGWVFTYKDNGGKGTSVSPVCDPDGCNPAWGAQACLKGSVAKDTASATFVGLAFHNNNPMSGGTGTWTVTGQGIFISVSSPPAVARLQLQEPNTSSNDQRYCSALPAGGTGLIPFSSFKTYCWGDPQHPSKTLTVGTPIHETAIVVPGNASADTPFDFCLVDIAPR